MLESQIQNAYRRLKHHEHRVLINCYFAPAKMNYDQGNVILPRQFIKEEKKWYNLLLYFECVLVIATDGLCKGFAGLSEYIRTTIFKPKWHYWNILDKMNKIVFRSGFSVNEQAICTP